MDEKELEKEIERLRASSAEMRTVVDQLLKSLGQIPQSSADLKKQVIGMAKQYAESSGKIRKSSDELKKDIEGLRDKFKKGAVSVEDLDDELVKLRKEIQNTSDQSKKAQLLKEKSDLEWAQAQDKASKQFKNTMGEMSGKLISGFVKSYTNAAAAALRGGDALSVAGEFMASQIDMANSATQVGAKGLQTFGAATAMAGGKLGAMGVAASLVGSVLGMVSDKAAELAKAGIQFLITETKKLTEGFQAMSAVGAIYSGGMMQMIDTANKAGMTLGQFSKVVAANRDNLTKTGLGIAEASRVMSKAMADGGKVARQGMYALGMSLEEQADSYANVMGLLAGPTGKLGASTSEIARETEKYAVNLKQISALTGEDMKTKQEAIRQANDTLAFQQVLDGMDETQRLNVSKSMLAMSDVQQRALRENLIYGTIISKDVAIAQSNNAALEKTNQSFYRLASQGKLTVDETLKVQGENAKDMQTFAMQNRALAMAGPFNADAAAAGKLILDTTKLTNKLSSESTAKVITDINTQLEAGKKRQRIEVNVMEMQQSFATEMENLAKNNLPAFATAVTNVINSLKADIQTGIDAVLKNATILSSSASKKWYEDPAILMAAMAAMAPLAFSALGKIGGLFKGPIAPPSPPAGATPATPATPGKAWKDMSPAERAKAGLGGPATTTTAPATPATPGSGKLANIGKNLKPGAMGIAGLAAIGGEIGADALKEAGYEKTGAGVSIGSSALGGAAMGAMLGPIGATVGAALGASYGLYKNWATLTGKEKKSAASASDATSESLIKLSTDANPDKLEKIAKSIKALAESLNPFAQGGKLYDLVVGGKEAFGKISQGLAEIYNLNMAGPETTGLADKLQGGGKKPIVSGKVAEGKANDLVSVKGGMKFAGGSRVMNDFSTTKLTGGGTREDPTSQRIVDLMGQIDAMFPGSTFVAGGGKHSGGGHQMGRALDWVLPDNQLQTYKDVNDRDSPVRLSDTMPAGKWAKRPRLADSERIKNWMKEQGFSKSLNEYAYPSPNATGGHFHAEFAKGGIVNGSDGGITATIGEAGKGANELIQPLDSNGRFPGMDELIEAVQELIDVTKDHKSISERTLYSNM